MTAPVFLLRGRIDGIGRAEVARYLRYGKAQPTGADADLIDSVIHEVEAVLDCRACWTRVPLTPLGSSPPAPSSSSLRSVPFACGPLELRSPILLRHIAGCTQAIVFVATAGLGIDRLLATYQRTSPARALVMQAAGAAAVEAWCEQLCAGWAAAMATEGFATRVRFSPGYGQWPLEEGQRGIFGWLEPSRHIGVSLTDGCLMIPTKSVSALVGLAPQPATE